MERIYSSAISADMEGRSVVVAGWVHEIRDLGGLRFLLIRDRDGLVQVTLPRKFVAEEVFRKSGELTRESVVKVTGKVRREERAPNGYELLPEDIELLSLAAAPLPLDPTGKVSANLDTRLDHRFMDLRAPRVAAIFKIRGVAMRAARDYLEKQGFLEVKTPRIISTASEGGTELFPLAYFEKEAFLAQSPQLYKQMMMASGLDRVYEIATYFRAEEHDTASHLNEVTAIDVEMGFIRDEEEVMEVAEGLATAMIEGVREGCERELGILGRELWDVERPFPRLKYRKALELLEEEEALRLKPGEDLNTEAEKALGRIMEREGHRLYFVTEYPLAIKPFYTMPDPEDPAISRSFDLELMGREIVSGSQRIHESRLLRERIRACGLREESFRSYLEAFEYGMPPHGGFGMGVERFLMLLLGLHNIREAVLFPRDRRRLTP